MILQDLKPLPAKVHQSTIKCVKACERKCFYKYKAGITLRGEKKKDAADLGNIYHKFQQLGPGHDKEVMAWVRSIQVEIMERVDAGEDLDGSLIRRANILTELFNKARAMAHIFWEMYPQPKFLRVVGSEIHHGYFDETLGVYLEGTIDRLLRDESTGYYWVRDHKSTGRNLKAILNGISWSIQPRIYRLLALNFLDPEYQCSPDVLRGFIFDAIQTPNIKQCRTDQKNAKEWNCSVEDAYLRRVKDWYHEKEDDVIVSKSVIFTEPLYSYELKADIDKMKAFYEKGMNPNEYMRDSTQTACFAWERECEYYDLCNRSPAQWGELFEKKYKIRERNEDEKE